MLEKSIVFARLDVEDDAMRTRRLYATGAFDFVRSARASKLNCEPKRRAGRVDRCRRVEKEVCMGLQCPASPPHAATNLRMQDWPATPIPQEAQARRNTRGLLAGCQL